MHTLPLVCHPSTPCAYAVTAGIDASGKGLWTFQYRIEGNIDRLLLPATTPPAFTDGLWQHTCFEAFIKTRNKPDYYEFNFSASGAWAVYRFDGYRQGMAAVTGFPRPRIVCRQNPDSFEVRVEADPMLLAGLAADELQAALSAVLESTGGQMSYWALAHPSAKPDFHHPDSFTLEL